MNFRTGVQAGTFLRFLNSRGSIRSLTFYRLVTLVPRFFNPGYCNCLFGWSPRVPGFIPLSPYAKSQEPMRNPLKQASMSSGLLSSWFIFTHELRSQPPSLDMSKINLVWCWSHFSSLSCVCVCVCVRVDSVSSLHSTITSH